MGKEGVAAEMDEILNAHLDMAEEHNEDIGMEFDEVDDENSEISDKKVEGEPPIIEPTPPEDGAGEGENAGGSGDDDGKGQPAAAKTPPENTPTEKPAIKFDDDNNIVDDKGEVIAKAGAERRLYQKLNNAETELTRVNAEHEGFRQFAQTPQDMGLKPQEAVYGMQLASDLKTKPVEAARAIVQEAMKAGYNLHDIIGDVEGVADSNMDMGAINRMIDSKLSPLTQQYEQQQQVQQEDNNRQANIDRYINTHEYADIHLDTIKHLMQNNTNLDPERAYYEVKVYAMQNELDFSQPLAPQMDAKQQQQVLPIKPEAPNPKPMPNGVVNSIEMQENSAFSSGDDDWDSIVRQSMRDAGM